MAEKKLAPGSISRFGKGAIVGVVDGVRNNAAAAQVCIYSPP
jgi:hypothetical protein